MAFSLTWMPQVLRNAGLKVAEHPGWEGRGRSEFGRPEGVMWHHTATKAPGNLPSLRTLVEGRSDLSGPLCNLALGRDGTYYVIAAGRANHAGEGQWKAIKDGNSRFIGIEAENRGDAKDEWPDVQIDAYIRGTAALLQHINRNADWCCAHGEYALPKGRKPDPVFVPEQTWTKVMGHYRNQVKAAMEGTYTAREMIPPQDTKKRPTLIRGDKEPLVSTLRTLVGLPKEGDFDTEVEARVREFQRTRQLVADGIVGPKTWEALDAVTPATS